MGKFCFTIMPGIAELERCQISERVKIALQYKKERGEVYAKIPFGFKKKGK